MVLTLAGRRCPGPVSLSMLLLLPALAAGCGPRAGAADGKADGASPKLPAGEARLTPDEIRAAHIAIATVGYRDLDRELAASGRIVFDDQRVTHVFSPVNGRVVRLLAQPGQRLRRATRWR
jgi:cobalt-zinc-cadmium efflux system membrane fusion protein